MKRLATLAVVAVAALGAMLGMSTPSTSASPDVRTTDIAVSVVIPASPTPSPTPTSTATPTPRPSPSDGPDLPTLPDPDATPTAPPVPGSPSTSADGLTLDPDRIEAGDTMVARGSGFTPGEQVQFVMYSSPAVIGSFVADAQGDIRITIPRSATRDLRTGGHVVEATGWSSHKVANAPFIVVSASASGESWFPWIVWLIVGIGVLLAIIAFSIAAARGRLPQPFTRVGGSVS